MKRMLIGRLAALLPTILFASFVVFILIQLAPGDPAMILAGENATAERIEEIRHRLGFDKPLVEQYWAWLSNAVQGDLGKSIITQESIATAIGRTLPITVHLVMGALVVAVIFGVIGGVTSARRANTATDAIVTSLSSAGAAMPSFWLGLVLVSIFALRFNWFPATGFVSLAVDPGKALRHLVLPSVALGAVGAAEIARQLRAVLIDILASDHVRTLRAKGLAERRIVWVHALRGAAVPLMTIIGLQVSRLLGATVVVEAVFGIQGIGTLVVAAAHNHDYYVVEGVVVVMAMIVILVNFAVDISYRLSDPRIR